MSPRFRRRAIAALALAAVLWPGVHLVWVARMDVDPWEFFGWAMYARPAARVQVRVEVEVERTGSDALARERTSQPLRAMGELRRELERYARRRSVLGRHADPARLRAKVFESDASIDAITIVERNVRLDLDSARLVGEVERTRHTRPGAAP